MTEKTCSEYKKFSDNQPLARHCVISMEKGNAVGTIAQHLTEVMTEQGAAYVWAGHPDLLTA